MRLAATLVVAATVLAGATPSLRAAATTAPGQQSRRDQYQRRFTGKPAPDFTLTDIHGNSFTLSRERGKVVLINFWYSSCVPCRRETPDLSMLHKTYSGLGFKVLGVNLDDLLIPEAGHASLKVFLQEFQPPYAILLGTNDVLEAYGGVPVQPISFLIDREGKVAKVFWGAFPGAVFEKAIRAQLEGTALR